MGNLPPAELFSTPATEARVRPFQVPERHQHLYDLVGTGTPFASSADFYKSENLPLLRTYAELACMSVQDMTNLLDKLLDGKQDFLDHSLTMRIDGQDRPLTNPITDLPLQGGDIGKARSGPEFSVPEHPRSAEALLDPRPVEDLEKIEKHAKAVLAKADAAGVIIPHREMVVAALTDQLRSPNKTNRPVSDLDFQITNHGLWRESLQNTICAALIEKYPEEGQALADTLRQRPGVMRDIAYTHMHEGGEMHLETVKQAITGNQRYTSLLREEIKQLSPDEKVYHPINGTMVRKYGTGLETHSAESREVEELADGSWVKIEEPRREGGNYKLVKTTDIYARYENSEIKEEQAVELLGKTCFKNKGLVEFKDVITTTWLDLEGVVGQDVVDRKHLFQLQKDISDGKLPGVSQEMLEECKQLQTEGRFSFRRLMADMQHKVNELDVSYTTKKAVYQNFGLRAEKATQDKDFSNQVLLAEEIGYKLAMCEQQKLDLATAEKKGTGMEDGNVDEVRKCRNKLIKTMADTGSYVESLHERRQHDSHAQALWEVVDNSYRNRLTQWGINSPEQLAEIGGLSKLITPEEFARVMSEPGQNYDTLPDDMPSLRRDLGLGKITPEMAQERIDSFSKGAEALCESARSQTQYFATAAELKRSFEALNANPDSADAQQAYVQAYGAMRVQIATELQKSPEVLNHFAELHGRDMAHDLVNLGASKAVSCVALDIRCKEQMAQTEPEKGSPVKQAPQSTAPTELSTEATRQVQTTVQELLSDGIEQRAQAKDLKRSVELQAMKEFFDKSGIKFDSTATHKVTLPCAPVKLNIPKLGENRDTITR